MFGRATITLGYLSNFLLHFTFDLISFFLGRLGLAALGFRIMVCVSFSVSYSCSCISDCQIKYPVCTGCCRNWSSVSCKLVPETDTSFWYPLAGTRNWYQNPVNVSWALGFHFCWRHYLGLLLVSWRLTSLFSTNMAISETNGHSLYRTPSSHLFPARVYLPGHHMHRNYLK